MKKNNIFATFLTVYILLVTFLMLYLLKDVFWSKETVSSQIQTLNTVSLNSASQKLETRDFETGSTNTFIDLESYQYGDSDPFR